MSWWWPKTKKAMSSSSSVEDFSRPRPSDGYYDVFISFRGADTRYGFTANLYNSLLENKIYTFMDVGLAGEVIDSLFDEIERSRMGVVVYSKKFASSDWCLRELETIVQRKEEKKMMMIPIFYKVDVHDVKHLTEKTTKYFDQHIEKYGKITVDKWKDVVSRIGAFSGFPYKDIYGRTEGDFIKQVIATIQKKLRQGEESGLESTSSKPAYNSGSGSAATGIGEHITMPKQEQPVKPNVDSVLQWRTGNFKELYSLGRKLGQAGQFGVRFLCVDKSTGKEFVCKSIAKKELLTDEDVEAVRREIQIMHHLDGHPNVISIKDAYEDAVAVHVVMELCTGGELFDTIIHKGHYIEREAAGLTRTIVGFVEACHSMGVMHRDLKPENFVFVDQREDSLLKTIDFGLSVFFKPGETFSDIVGSPNYVAPEVLNRSYGPEADVWSAGVILYILLSGVPPFWAVTEQGIIEQVLHGDLDFVSDPWPSISESAKDLVRKMLVRDPRKRPTAHQVLCHPWVQVDGVAPDKPLDSAVLSRLKQFSSMNKLKNMAIRVIAESVSEDEIAGLKEMFKMIDTDKSGLITFEELNAGLKRVGANLKEIEIYYLMQAVDVDKSGTIDYGEFLAAMLHLNKVKIEQHLFAAFSYFDKDGSGYITMDDLQQACEEFGMDDDHLEELIREFDQDNDGRIDYNEFVAMMHKENPTRHRERCLVRHKPLRIVTSSGFFRSRD